MTNVARLSVAPVSSGDRAEDCKLKEVIDRPGGNDALGGSGWRSVVRVVKQQAERKHKGMRVRLIEGHLN